MHPWKIILWLGSVLLGVVGLSGIPDDIQGWWKWLKMIDHDMVRYALVAVALAGFAYLHKDRLYARVPKLPMVRQRRETPLNWEEFNFLPLKYAACMWHGLPPTEASLQKPIIQEELARLSLAVKQRKIEHRLGDTYHGFLILLGTTPANDQFSKLVLARYAKEAGRDIPAFLQSVDIDDPDPSRQAALAPSPSSGASVGRTDPE